MSAALDALHGRVVGGRYQLGRPLGTGAAAVSYEAVDLQLERNVAVKIITAPGTNEPGFQRRFRELAAELSALSHPNILAVYDWGHEDVGLGDRAYLVTELVTGGSLRGILDRGRTLTPSQALLVGLDVCRGLDHAHRKGLVHGDIKPANLLFGADRRVRIADFGIEALIARTNKRRAGDLDIADARYVSPEQAQDFVIDHKSDVYSLALTLVESVTGSVPFAGDTTVATLAGRIDKLLPVSADLGPLASVLDKAGRPTPAERSSAAELGRALVAAAEKLPKPAPLPLATGGPALFEAPEGQETTSELTRFRDSTGALLRDPTSPEGTARPRTRTTGDPTGGTPRPRVVTVDEDGARTDEKVRRPRGPVLAYLALIVGLIAASAFAVVAYQRLTEKSYDVPSLVGLDEGAARNLVASNGWKITVTQQESDTVAQGKVVKTDPPAGATLKQGAALALVVSSGPPLATLPDVSGQTVDAATAALSGAGLALQQGDEKYDETVAAGVVMSWQVTAQPGLAAGAQIVRGTQVTVTVSKGPAPRTVPKLVGKTMDDAKATVGELALGVQEQGDQVFSNDIPAGSIVSQSVPAGQKVDRGTTITVVLSKGQDLVALPDVQGQTLDTVDAALRGAGFNIGTIEGTAFGGKLVGVSYKGAQATAGQPLPRGATLNLIFL